MWLNKICTCPRTPLFEAQHDEQSGFPENLDLASLTGAGVGLMMDFGSRISTRLTFAYPLDNNPSEMNHRSPRILAGVNVSWF
jgi:hypothetical protein